MPFYHKLGNIPPKRHTQFRKPMGIVLRTTFWNSWFRRNVDQFLPRATSRSQEKVIVLNTA